MNKQTERMIHQIYVEVLKKIYNKQRLGALANGQRFEIFEAAAKLEQSNAYNEFAKRFAKELAKKGLNNKRGVWRKYYEAAKKAHYVALPKTWTAFEAAVMKNAILHNFNMIKSIPNETLKMLNHKYMSTLIEEVAKGNLARGSFERQLMSHGHKNARLIARTESAKLQTAITENRAISLDSVAYEWLASKDKRTRPSHRAMDGVIVFWRPDQQKPLLDNMRGNAGEFPNCRCDPQPIFDESDLTNSSYKVYDYRSDKVVRMSKKELLNHLQKGSLE